MPFKPSISKPNSRYFVPDLSPEGRQELSKERPRFVFIAESPHVSEVEPEELEARRPLCGSAGRQWWGLLSELLEGKLSQDVSLERLESFCRKHGIAIINAVQYPMDPKVAARFPKADPAQNIGFNKVSGKDSYKKLKKSPQVQHALDELTRRMQHPALARSHFYCLGNDSYWFVTQAVERAGGKIELQDKLPHPSAWWRSGGLYGRIAREKLEKIFERS